MLTHLPPLFPLCAALACPLPGEPMVTTSAGMKSVSAAAADTFCGIFLRKQSGDLIPLARSYHGEEWEAAPGPLACPTEDVNATNVLLPDLQDANDSYVILSKDGSMDDLSQIAKFLEMTTFGVKMSEIDALSASWSFDSAAARAQYLRQQMDAPATSHREYWRLRTNSKWDATAQPARSDHPCSPKSKWRRYAYTRQDVYHTITSERNEITFEVVPEEAHLTTTIYEADSVTDVTSYSDGTFVTTSNYGYSGSGYFDFGGTGAFLEMTVNVPSNGTYPISYRYAISSSRYVSCPALETVPNSDIKQIESPCISLKHFYSFFSLQL